MKKIKQVIKKRFPDFNFQKIILYKNPNECKKMYIEKVNPTHVGIIWGRRKKSLNKGSNFIKIGKVYFGLVWLSVALNIVGWLDMFTGYAYNLLLSVGVLSLTVALCLSLMFYGCMFRGVNKWICSLH